VTQALTVGHIYIIIIVSYHRFPAWYLYSWTSGASHHSGFKFQVVALSLVCAMSLVSLALYSNVGYSDSGLAWFSLVPLGKWYNLHKLFRVGLIYWEERRRRWSWHI